MGLHKQLNTKRSKADPCLFYKWDPTWGLVMWLTWIHDKLCIAHRDCVKSEKEMLMQHFKCDDIGIIEDFIGCKIDIDHEERSLTMTQPVLVQSLTDKFEDIPQGAMPMTPAKPGSIITKGEEDVKLSPEMNTRYQAGVCKLLYLAKNSRPDIENAVRA